MKCKTLPNEFKIIQNKTELKPQTLVFENDLENSFCCLNRSHSVTYYGDCKFDTNKLKLSDESKFIMSDKCIGREHQFSSFVKYQTCVFQISYFTICFTNTVIDNCNIANFPCKYLA